MFFGTPCTLKDFFCQFKFCYLSGGTWFFPNRCAKDTPKLFNTLVNRLLTPFLVMIRYKHTNELKISESCKCCTHLLYCSVLSLGGNVNTRRVLQPDMRFIFLIQNQWNILIKGNYMRIIKIIKIKCFYPPRILNKH